MMLPVRPTRGPLPTIPLPRGRRGTASTVRLASKINPLQRRKAAAAVASKDAVDKSIVDSGHGRSFDRLATAVRATFSAAAAVRRPCITHRCGWRFVGPAVTCVWAIKGVAWGPEYGNRWFYVITGTVQATERKEGGGMLDWRPLASSRIQGGLGYPSIMPRRLRRHVWPFRSVRSVCSPRLPVSSPSSFRSSSYSSAHLVASASPQYPPLYRVVRRRRHGAHLCSAY